MVWGLTKERSGGNINDRNQLRRWDYGIKIVEFGKLWFGNVAYRQLATITGCTFITLPGNSTRSLQHLGTQLNEDVFVVLI